MTGTGVAACCRLGVLGVSVAVIGSFGLLWEMDRLNGRLVVPETAR